MTKRLRDPPPRKATVRNKSRTYRRGAMRKSHIKSENETGFEKSSPVPPENGSELRV